MMSAPPERDDISPYVFHLTKDSSDRSAYQCLLSILHDRRIEARNAHCLHMHKLTQLHVSEYDKDWFKTVCLSEVPMQYLQELIDAHRRTQVRLEPYGLVFDKPTIIACPGQPAIYVNKWRGYEPVGAAVDALFSSFCQRGNDEGAWRLLPFINTMAERYDYTWEREWRVPGMINLDVSRPIAVIIPSEKHPRFRDRLTTAAVPWISPGMKRDDIEKRLAQGGSVLDVELESLETDV